MRLLVSLFPMLYGCGSMFASLFSVFLGFIMVAGFMMGRRGMMVLSGLMMSLRGIGMML
jgi:hypothetical protein